MYICSLLMLTVILICIAFLFQSLPAPVKRRIKALKKLQLETANIEAKFYQEVHELECKYHNLYYPLYEKVIKSSVVDCVPLVS